MSDGIERRVREALGSDELGRTLADADIDEAEALVRSTLKSLDPRIELAGFGEKPRAILRELELEWRLEGVVHREVVSLPEVSL